MIHPPPDDYHDPHGWMIGQYYQAMADEIEAKWDDIGEVNPRWRAVCFYLLDLDGRIDSPNTPVIAGIRYVGANDSTAFRGDFMPQWATYGRRAKEILDAIDAIDAIDRVK